MQKKYTLVGLTCILAGTVAAQPTLTFDESGPQPSGAPYAITANTTAAPGVYEPGLPGADQLYGFWMIPETGNRDIFHLEPSVTPTSANFPGATVLTTNGGADTTFWRADANGVELLGVRGGTEGIAPYSNTAQELPYPCTFGTTWNDAFAASFTVSGFPVTRAGTINGVADGYGTIQLPAVELEDVLRVKVRKVQIDQTPLGTLYRSYETYLYYQAGIRYPLMRTSVDTLTVNSGTPSVTWSAEWLYGTSSVGMDDVEVSDALFTPYPNPTNGLVDLRLTGVDARAVEVLTATGRIAMQQAVRNTGGSIPALDLSGLAPGVYQLRLTEASGRQITRKVVLQ